MDSYAVGVRRLESFRSQYGFDQCWPPSIETLSLFIASLSLQGLAFKTAKSYLSAIAFQCKLKSVEDVTKHFVIKKLLDGMERTGSKKMVRLPITISMLNSIVPKLSAVCINSYESLLFVAAFTLAFFGFFRVGELTITKPEYIDKVVAINDVVLSADHSNLVILLRFSKTD